MKWCQRCGQQLKPVLPGKSCTQCGWVRPLVAPRRKRKQASILTPLAEMHERLRTANDRLHGRGRSDSE